MKYMPTNLRTNQTKLLRRDAIRRLLAGRGYSYKTGITSYGELRDELAELGHDVSEITVRKDMEALKAVKIKIEGETQSFWFIPPWDPAMDAIKATVDQNAVEQEVAARIAAYAADAFPWQNEVIILTEQNCGRMLADWIAMLEWPGLIHVREHAHSVSCLCDSPERAVYIRNRLYGVQ